MKISKGVKLTIQSYKHNRQLHRAWNRTTVLEVNNQQLITAHKRARVIEDNARRWFTREPAVCFFYPDNWFNIIAMLKKDGVYFYCNISSPYLIDEEGIKYIDYDLDVKVFPDGNYKILDQNEFKFHSRIMEYPEKLIKILNKEMEILIKRIEAKEDPFNEDYIKELYKRHTTKTKKKAEK